MKPLLPFRDALSLIRIPFLLRIVILLIVSTSVVESQLVDSSKKQTEAVQAVADQYKPMSEKLKTDMSSGGLTNPYGPIDGMGRYCEAMVTIDLKQCPTDFQKAFVDYRTACLDFYNTMRASATAMGTLNLLKGKITGSSTVADEGRKKESVTIEKWGEVEKSALNHGVSVTR